MLKWFSGIFGRKDSTLKSSQRKDDIERLLSNYKHRLQILKEPQTFSGQNASRVAPHILMEIEDIEAEIQRLQGVLENETVKNKGEIERMIRDYKRRLQKLKGSQMHPQQSTEIEMKEIEAKIQRLQDELADENCKNRDERKAMIMAHERRLQKLKEIEIRTVRQDSNKEIEEIEAEIEQLQIELKRLGS